MFTHCGLVISYCDIELPDGTKPLPQPMLTNHRGLAAFATKASLVSMKCDLSLSLLCWLFFYHDILMNYVTMTLNSAPHTPFYCTLQSLQTLQMQIKSQNHRKSFHAKSTPMSASKRCPGQSQLIVAIILWHRTGTTLVMAFCLMAPSHYLNQYCLIITGLVAVFGKLEVWFKSVIALLHSQIEIKIAKSQKIISCEIYKRSAFNPKEHSWGLLGPGRCIVSSREANTKGWLPKLHVFLQNIVFTQIIQVVLGKIFFQKFFYVKISEKLT